MSSLARCIEIAGISKVEGDRLLEAQKQYLKEGYSAKEAAQGAVKDAIADLEGERKDVFSQLEKKLGKPEKPSPAPEAAEVAGEGVEEKPAPKVAKQKPEAPKPKKATLVPKAKTGEDLTPGRAWVNEQWRPIVEAREITRGKQKGKVEITLPNGKKKKVDAADIKTWPEASGRRVISKPVSEERRTGEDRRADQEERKRVSDLSLKEAQKELLTSYLTGLQNKRAYDEAEKKPVQASIDADGMKWVNDTFGHTEGDKFIVHIANALRQIGKEQDTFHVSGDEFIFQGDTVEGVDADLSKAIGYLENNPMTATTPDGVQHTVPVRISYGTGQTYERADTRLKAAKEEATRRGERAERGAEPPGVLREVPKGDEVQPAEVAPEKPKTRLQAKKSEEKPKATVKTRKAKREAEKIEDFGEKIGGARKDYYAEFFDKMKEAKDLNIASEPLSRTWPEPNYQRLLDEGADPYIVGFIRAARDEIPVKPRTRFKLSRWVARVEMLRDMSEGLLSGDLSKTRLKENLEKDEFATVKRDIGGRAELYQEFGHEKSLKGVRFHKAHYSMYRGEKDVTKWIIEKDRKATAFGNMPRELGIGDTREEALEAFRQKYEDLGKKPKAKGVKFQIYSKRGEDGYWIGKKIGRDYVDLERFDSVTDARNYLKENQEVLESKLEKWKQIPSERRTVNRERIGKDHRGGKDVTPEMFQESFGFRGVEFGNWVNSKERQDNLNRAYDALMDLALILDIPTQAISLNGELGMGFGSRGKGGKNAPAAHYEPEKVVINLTRKNGPGSLAHEWWHALDNYFSRQRGKKTEYLFENPLKEAEDTTRPEVLAAFKNVVDAIKKTGLEKRSKQLDRRRSKPYWATGREMAARTFEHYVVEKAAEQGNVNDYLANIQSASSYASDMMDALLESEADQTAVDFYPYLLDKEVDAVKDAYDNLFDTIEARETDKGTALYATGNVAPWPTGFPNVTAHTSQGRLAGHPDHAAAKAGDTEAAIRLVRDLVDVGKVRQITRAHPNAKLVPVAAVEASGHNKIPAMLAQAISDITGLEVDTDIFQENVSAHTKKTGLKRLLSRAKVDGKVEPGREYIIVDDAVTQGGTLSELRHFIDNGGGKTVGATTLGYSRFSTVLAVRPATIEKIKEKFGREKTERFLKEYDIAGSLEALTQSEAREILKYSSLDSLRTRIAEEGYARVDTEGEGPVQRFSVGKPLRFSNVTLSDIQSFFKGQQVGLSPDGSVWVRTKSGKGLQIRTVDQITPDRLSFSIAYGRMQKDGEFIKGKYQDGKIELSRDLADIHTLQHESLHFLEDAGFIAPMERAALNKAAKRMFPDMKPGPEARAAAVETMLRERTEAKGALKRALQKIGDFIDGLVNLWRKTARGVVRGIESGKIFNRKVAGETVQTTVPQYEKTAGRWYSQMANVLSQKLQKTGTPAQMKQTIQAWANKGEFKSEELEWSGLIPWLESQEGKVSKREVLDFVAENNLRVEEVVKGGGRELSKIGTNDPDVFDVADMNIGETVFTGTSQEADNYIEKHGGDTKFSQYTTPGGQQYRELLITMPDRPTSARARGKAALEEFWNRMEEKYGEPEGTSLALKMSDEEHAERRKIASEIPWGDRYTSSHWSEPNVLAHVRFDERTDSEGRRVLHIAEVQSDWLQAIRKKGSRADKRSADDVYISEEDARQWVVQVKDEPGHFIGIGKDEAKTADEAIQKALSYIDKNWPKSEIPDAPWKKTWPLKAFQRIVRYGAENGYDAITWDPGSVQAERYDLSKHLDRIEYSKERPGEDFGTVDFVAYDKQGNEVISERNATPERMEEVVGKEIVEKIAKADSTDGELSGVDLEVGGEGMKSFYDRLLPNEVNKFFNKAAWGKAKVGTTTIKADNAPEDVVRKYEALDPESPFVKKNRMKVHSLPITPEMRSKALTEGMPLFQSSEAAQELRDNTLSIGEKLGTVFQGLKPRSLTKKPKSDLSRWDVLASIPEFFKHKIKAVGKMFQSTQDRQDEKNELVFWAENHDDVNVITAFKGLRKAGKKSFEKVGNYLVHRDRKRIGYRLAHDKQNQKWLIKDTEGKVVDAFETEIEAAENMIVREAGNLKKSGWTPQEIQAVVAFRQSTNKGFEILFQAMRRLIATAEKEGIPVPKIQVEGKEVSLEKAMAMMGDMRGYYFPRIRKPGRFILTAYKDNEYSRLETFNFKKRMDIRAVELEKQGWKVRTAPSEQLGEDVFELSGNLIKTQQIINAALDRVDQQLKDAGKGDIENILKQTEEIFATSVAEQVANVVRERGSRVHMTKRTDDVFTGYEENPEIAIAKYIRGLAGGEAKRNMVIKMLKAFTGTELTWREFQEQNPDSDWADYRKHVQENMIDQRKQPQAFKWAKAYIAEVTRNDEFGDRVIGGIRGLAVAKYLAFRFVAAPMVNLTALPTSVIASMKGAGIPYSRTWGHLGRAIKDWGLWKAGKLKGENKKIFDYIRQKGWDNPQFNSESMTALRGWLGNKYDKVIDFGMFTFSESERLNRAATIAATYRGLKGKTKWVRETPTGKTEIEYTGKGIDLSEKGFKKVEQSFEELMDRAKEVSDKSHGIYNKGNYPFLAMGANPAAQVARMFYVFRTFSHTYLLNLKRLGLEEKDIAAAAHMVVAPAVIAGMGASVLTPMITKLLEAFGFDEPEEELYLKIGEAFGPRSEYMARYGLPGALSKKGWSIKGSLALGITDLPTSIGDILGAPGSVLSDIFIDGIPAAAKGDVMKGFEKILPTGFGNMIRAYRESTEGLTTRTNRPLFYGTEAVKLTPMETFYRTLSLYPARIAKVREQQWKEYQLEKKYRERSRDIYAKFKKLVLNGVKDKNEWAEVFAEVEAYNQDAVGLRIYVPRITSKSIRTNIKRSFKPSKKERLRKTG